MRPTLTAFVTAILLLALAPEQAAAQEGADPFGTRHNELLRAAEFHLLQAGTPRPVRPPLARPETATLTPDLEGGVFAAISPARLAAARQKLRALGVDARRVFAEEGVPEELLVIAEVESAFDPHALSPKGARGLWQFMPETARRYGLRVNQHVDERLHVGRSTRAAARYLRDLYLLFGDWQFALTAYNAGESRVAAAIDQSGSRNFTQASVLLPRETQIYARRVLRGSPAAESPTELASRVAAYAVE